jgi:hypothetical protein
MHDAENSGSRPSNGLRVVKKALDPKTSASSGGDAGSEIGSSLSSVGSSSKEFTELVSVLSVESCDVINHELILLVSSRCRAWGLTVDRPSPDISSLVNVALVYALVKLVVLGHLTASSVAGV